MKRKYYDGIPDYSHLSLEELDEVIKWNEENPPDEWEDLD